MATLLSNHRKRTKRFNSDDFFWIVGLAAFLTGVFAKYVFDYGWDWNTAMMFGAIMSATDPVAVVALLRELGKKNVAHLQLKVFFFA